MSGWLLGFAMGIAAATTSSCSHPTQTSILQHWTSPDGRITATESVEDGGATSPTVHSITIGWPDAADVVKENPALNNAVTWVNAESVRVWWGAPDTLNVVIHGGYIAQYRSRVVMLYRGGAYRDCTTLLRFGR
jgi:hypothetical protein